MSASVWVEYHSAPRSGCVGKLIVTVSMAMTEPSRGESGPLASFRATRGELWFFLLGAVALAFGVNLVSDAAGNKLSGSAALAVGIPVCMVAVTLLVLSRERRRRASYCGWVLAGYDQKGNVDFLAPVPRYELADQVARQTTLFTSYVAEAAMRWRDRPQSLIRDATESLCLQALGDALEDTLRRDSFERDIVTVTREELGDVFQGNLVLDLISDPDLFPVDASSLEGEYEALVFGGTVGYQRMHLSLPRGSRLQRRNGDLRVKTRRCTIAMKTECSGAATVVPESFDKHYLAPRDLTSLSPLEVDVTVDVRFDVTSFIPGRALQYHDWIDGWLKRVQEKVEVEAFYTRIGWEPAATVIDWLIDRGIEGLGAGGLKQLVEQALDELRSQGIVVESSPDGDLHRVRFGSAAVFLEAAGGAAPTRILLTAPVLQDIEDENGSRPRAIVAELNEANAVLGRGRFVYQPQSRAIFLRKELITGHVVVDELVATIRAVGDAADRYDDDLKQRLGTGRTAAEIFEVQEVARTPEVPPQDRRASEVLDDSDWREVTRVALQRAAIDADGQPVTKRIRAADGRWVDVVVASDGLPLTVTMRMSAFGRPDERGEVMFMATRAGLIATILDDAGHPTATAESILEIETEGNGNDAAGEDDSR